MSSTATSCTQDLSSRISAVGRFQKEVYVTSIDDFVAKLSGGVKTATAGVLYEGARPITSQAGRDINVSVEYVFSVLIAIEQPTVNLNVNKAPLAQELLDALRDEIHGARSPAGHRWKWVVEAPVVMKGVVGVWLQRWSTTGQLAPKGNCT